jgi:hypothetical protein
MAKPDAGQNAYGAAQNLQGAMGRANAGRNQYRAASRMKSLRNQSDMAGPDSTGGGNLGDVPAGKFNPMMGRPMLGLGSNNYLAALQPPGPTTMPPPGGNNYMSNMLQKTRFNPAEGQIGIRRPMADQMGPDINQAQPQIEAARQRMQAFSPFGRFGG